MSQPDLQAVLLAVSYVVECQREGQGVTSHYGWINGEMDWIEEIHRLVKGDLPLMSSGTDEFGTPYDQTQFPNKLNPNERQVGGDHYRTEYQHWDLMGDLIGADYFVAQITRYLTRWRKKEGVRDVEKALHYFEKLRSLIDNRTILWERYPSFNPSWNVERDLILTKSLDRFVTNNPQISPLELTVFHILFERRDLGSVAHSLSTILEEAKKLDLLDPKQLVNSGSTLGTLREPPEVEPTPEKNP